MTARLLVNPGTDQSWIISLRPGTNRIGRTDDNDHQVADESISSAHCEIEVAEDAIRLTDLGSTNGTFVNGSPVQEATVEHGQSVRLGNVEMMIEMADAVEESAASAATPLPVPAPAAFQCPPPPMAPPIPRVTQSAGPVFCKFHPKSLAHYQCPQCNRNYCDVCVSTRTSGGVIRKLCRACSVECIPLKQTAARIAPVKRSFAQSVRYAFAYPLRGDGAILLVAGTIFFLMIDAAKFLAGFAPLIGLVAIVFLTVFGTGYLVCYLRRIITSTAWGENKMPDWPDLTDFGSDILSPFVQFLATVLVSFLPAILLAMFVAADNAWAAWSVVAAILLGCALFPMCFLAVAMFDSVGALNPLLIIPSILKVPLEYLLTIGLFAVILVMRWLGEELVPQFVPIPFVPSILFSFAGLYLLTVEMRILGVLYARNKHELGWFSH